MARTRIFAAEQIQNALAVSLVNGLDVEILFGLARPFSAVRADVWHGELKRKYHNFEFRFVIGKFNLAEPPNTSMALESYALAASMGSGKALM